MSLSKELSEQVAHYRRRAKEFREKAEQAEFSRMKHDLLAVADQWAALADATASEVAANDHS